MNYNIDLKVERGFISLENASGQIPEGTFSIGGHMDSSQESLAVHRRNADGTFAGSAHHSHPVPPVPKPEPDPDEGF